MSIRGRLDRLEIMDKTMKSVVGWLAGALLLAAWAAPFALATAQ